MKNKKIKKQFRYNKLGTTTINTNCRYKPFTPN